MKKYLTLFAVLSTLFITGLHAGHQHFQKNEVFQVQEKQYWYKTCFEMDSNHGPIGTVEKSSLRVFTNYDLYDNEGTHQATGTQEVGWGSLGYAWAIDIVVKEPNGYKIGMIDGQWITTASAKYYIRDEYDEVIAIAYLDNTNSGFTISYPDNDAHWIARLTRHFVTGQIDKWEVKVYDHEAIRPEIIKIFAAFAVDHQEFFQEDL